MERAPEPETSLWEYALANYQRPGVAESCLALQDLFDADVNLLLAAGWLAQRGYRWRRDQVAELIYLCSDWRTRCLLPLRAVRRYLRERMGGDDTVIGNLYRQSKRLELEAERYQLQMIEEAVPAPLTSDQPSSSLLKDNLEAYLSLLPANPMNYRKTSEALLAALASSA